MIDCSVQTGLSRTTTVGTLMHLIWERNSVCVARSTTRRSLWSCWTDNSVVKMFSHATSGTLQVLMWTKPVGLFKPSWMCFRIVLQCLCDYFHKHNCKCEVVYCNCSSLSIYSDSSTYVCTFVCVSLCSSTYIHVHQHCFVWMKAIEVSLISVHVLFVHLL